MSRSPYNKFTNSIVKTNFDDEFVEATASIVITGEDNGVEIEVAEVFLSKHGDIITYYNQQCVRCDPRFSAILKSSKSYLKKDIK